MNFITKQVKFRYNNAKFYAIKLGVDSLLESNPFFKQLFAKYGDSLLLYAFYSATVITNMTYSKKNINSKIRFFLISLGSKGINHNFEYPIHKESCPAHVKEGCIDDILYVTGQNIKNLAILYTKLGILTSVMQGKFNAYNFVIKIMRSTAFLTIYPLLYRIYMDSITNYRGYNTIFDSQLGITFGSLGFLVESPDRQKMINKYMTGLYLHDITSQMELTHEKTWKIIFILLLTFSTFKRGTLKTVMSILL